MTEVVPRPIGVAQRRLRGPGERIGGPIRVGKRRSQRAGKGVARPIAVVQRGVAAGTRSGRPKLGDRRPLPKHDETPKHRLSEEKSRRFRGHVRAPMVKLVPLVPPRLRYRNCIDRSQGSETNSRGMSSRRGSRLPLVRAEANLWPSAARRKTKSRRRKRQRPRQSRDQGTNHPPRKFNYGSRCERSSSRMSLMPESGIVCFKSEVAMLAYCAGNTFL